MRFGRGIFLCVLLLASMTRLGHARPIKPMLSPGAAAALASGPQLLLPDDNLLVPLAGKGKATPLLQTAPKRLEILSTTVGGETLLAIEQDLFSLKAGVLKRVASGIYADPALGPEGLVLSIEDKRGLVATRGEEVTKIPYRRSGSWELVRPYVFPDGKHALVTVHDFSQALDGWQLLLVDLVSKEVEEVNLSRSFAPGPLRQPLGPTKVLFQMYAQKGDSAGGVGVSFDETDFAVFDLATKKMSAPPAEVLPGQPSVSGKVSLLPGTMRYSDDKRCGGDNTFIYLAGKKKPLRFADGTEVVSLIDVTPDEKALVGFVLDVRGCKGHGVLVPLGADGPAMAQSAWRPLGIPYRNGQVRGRVIQ